MLMRIHLTGIRRLLRMFIIKEGNSDVATNAGFWCGRASPEKMHQGKFHGTVQLQLEINVNELFHGDKREATAKSWKISDALLMMMMVGVVVDGNIVERRNINRLFRM